MESKAGFFRGSVVFFFGGGGKSKLLSHTEKPYALPETNMTFRPWK